LGFIGCLGEVRITGSFGVTGDRRRPGPGLGEQPIVPICGNPVLASVATVDTR